ncbi:hypothetical protein O3M35_008404 [Rhynocoris fuscipes]|uniref:Uncharacterized protein n=1 Tax=Rhynocoris fuscipes TaxID=488301 RepID=A0AAW1D8T1_9HEMI
MVKVKKGKKIVSKSRSEREGSVESTFSKEGSVAGDGSTENDSPVEMSDVEENINESEEDTAEDSGNKENCDNVEGTDARKINKGDGAEKYMENVKVSQPLLEQKIFPLCILGLVFILLGVASAVYFDKSENSQSKNGVKQLEKTILKFEKNFPTQGKRFWYEIYSGIKYVDESKPTKPAVFLLLHNNIGDVADCLAWSIGKAASDFLETPGMIEVLPENAKDYRNNDLITIYEDELKSKGVMIVYKLDQLSGLVAKSFHSFCDTYNPLVNRAVLLFTLNDSYSNETMTANRKAQELMKTLWENELMDSTLDPLITRLTDRVLEIKSEKHLSCPQTQ